jgi:glycosyltransferase involved in cell wall biosynthesis
MKIGIDARFLTHPQRGGFKSYTYALVNALAETNGGNEYVLYTDRPAESMSLRESFQVTSILAANSILREQLVLPWVMMRDGVDLAHFPCNTGPVIFGPKMIVTMHDAIPLRNDKGGASLDLKQRVLRQYWRTVMPRAAQRARLLTTVSEHARQELCDRLRLPESAFRVIPGSIDPVFLGDEPGSRPADVSPDARFLLAFASRDGRKNHGRAAESFRLASSKFPGLSLVIVCSHPSLRSTIEGGRGVIPVGPASMEELVWLYRHALALVFPSLDEGFGLPPLEAMACGTPVVASNAGSLPQVLGDSAYFADPIDAQGLAQGINAVLSDGALRADLIARGRRRATEFSRERMGRRLTAVYAEAAGDR